MQMINEKKKKRVLLNRRIVISFVQTSTYEVNCILLVKGTSAHQLRENTAFFPMEKGGDAHLLLKPCSEILQHYVL